MVKQDGWTGQLMIMVMLMTGFNLSILVFKRLN